MIDRCENNQAREVQLMVRGIDLKAKLWHEEAPIKVIALHGWLDNAASFDLLAPMLPNCAILALDQAGNAQSEFRPPSSTYHLWDDVLDIIAVVDQMGWSEVVCLGHSRGAMLSMLLASAQPLRFTKQILLDGFLPKPVKAADAPNQLKGFVDAYSQAATWSYHDSYDQLVQSRMRAGEISLPAVHLLAERAIHQDEKGYYWRVDPRLKHPSAMKMTYEQVIAFVDATNIPTTVILAKEGVGQYGKVQQVISGRETYFDYHEVAGHHHFHMDSGVEEIAQICTSVLS